MPDLNIKIKGIDDTQSTFQQVRSGFTQLTEAANQTSTVLSSINTKLTNFSTRLSTLTENLNANNGMLRTHNEHLITTATSHENLSSKIIGTTTHLNNVSVASSQANTSLQSQSQAANNNASAHQTLGSRLSETLGHFRNVGTAVGDLVTSYRNHGDGAVSTAGRLEQLKTAVVTAASSFGQLAVAAGREFFNTAVQGAARLGEGLLDVGRKVADTVGHFGRLAVAAGAEFFSHAAEGALHFGEGLLHLGLHAGEAVLHVGHLIASGAEHFFEGVKSAAEHAAEGVLHLTEGLIHVAEHLGGHMISEAADFQAELNKIQYLTDANTQSMTEYRNAAIQMGQDTTFTSKQAAENLATLNKLHFEGADAININKAAANSAMLNNIDLGKSTEAITSTLHAYGLQATDVGHLTDQMNMATKLGKLDFEDFSGVMSRSGAVSRQTSQDFASLSAGLLAQTNAGDNADHAAQMLRSTLIGLAAPTDKAKAALKDLGVSVFDSNGKMKDYSDIIAQVQAGTKGMTDAQTDALLKDAFGKNNIIAVTDAMHAQFTTIKDGIPTVLHGSEALKAMEEQIRNSDGTTDKAAKTLEQGFNYQLKQMRGSLAEAGIAIGTGLLPGASALIGGFTGVLNKFIEMETETHIITNTFTFLGNTLNTTLKPAFDVVSSSMEKLFQFISGASVNGISGELKKWGDQMEMTGQSSSTLGTVVRVAGEAWSFFQAKVEPVIGTLIHISETISPLGIIVRTVIGFMTDGFSGAVDSLRVSTANIGNLFGVNLLPVFDGVVSLFGKVISVVQDSGPGILAAISQAFSGITSAIQPLVGPISTLVGQVFQTIGAFIQSDGPIIIQGFGAIFSGAVSFISSIMTGLVNVLSPIISIISDLWVAHSQQILSTVTQVWSQVSSFIGTTLTTVGSVVGSVLTTIGNFISTHHQQIENIITTAWTVISTVVSTAINAVSTVIHTVFTTVQQFWSEHGTQIMTTAQIVWNSVTTAISTAINTASTVIQTVITAVQQFWTENGNQILTTAQNIWNTVSTVVSTVINAVSGVVMSVVGSIVSFWQQNHEEILQAATNIWNAVSAVVGTAINAASTVITTVVGTITGLWNTFGDTILKVITDAWNGVTKIVNDVIKLVEDAVKGFIDLVTGNWKGFGEDVKKFWDDAWNAVIDAIKGFGKTIVDTVSGFIKDAGNFITTYDWASLGKGIINGIVDGIKSLPGAIFDGLKSVVGGGVDMVKGFLGIKSPSTYFAQEIGKPISQGIGVGITDGSDDVSSAAVGVVNTAIADAKGTARAASSIGNAIASGMAAGINAEAASVANAAAAAASNAIGAAREEIQSHSPSKKAHNEVGLPISQGIATGITAGEDLIHGSITNIANGAIEHGKAAFSISGTTSQTSHQALGLPMAKGIADGLTAGVEMIKKALDELLRATVQTGVNTVVSENPSDRIGGLLTRHVAAGITSGAPAVNAVANDFARGVINSVKAPDGTELQVGATNIGMEIVNGVMTGVMIKQPDANKAGADLGKGVTQAITQSFVGNQGDMSEAASNSALTAILHAKSAIGVDSSGISTVAQQQVGLPITSGIMSGINIGTNLDVVPEIYRMHAKINIAHQQNLDIVNDVSNVTTDRIGQPIARGVARGIDIATGAATTSVKNMVTSVMNSGTRALETNGGPAEILGQPIATGVERGVNSYLHRATGAVTNMANAALSAGNTTIGSSGGSPSSVFSESVGKGISKGVEAGIIGHGERVSLGLNQVITDALHSKDNVAATFKPIGSHIADGIADGILAGSKLIQDAATAAAQAALNAAKAALGIHSPSSVMAEQVGAPVMQGIQMGMMNALPDLITATQAYTLQMVASSQGALSGASNSAYSSMYYNNGPSSMGNNGGTGYGGFAGAPVQSPVYNNQKSQTFNLTANYQLQTRDSLMQDVLLTQRMANFY